MTNYALLLEFMGIDRLEHADSVRVRIDSSTDVGVFLRDPKVNKVYGVKLMMRSIGSQTDVKRRAFDKGALATGGIIERRPDTIV